MAKLHDWAGQRLDQVLAVILPDPAASAPVGVGVIVYGRLTAGVEHRSLLRLVNPKLHRVFIHILEFTIRRNIELGTTGVTVGAVKVPRKNDGRQMIELSVDAMNLERKTPRLLAKRAVQLGRSVVFGIEDSNDLGCHDVLCVPHFASGSSTSGRLFRGEFTSVDTSVACSQSDGQGFSMALIASTS